MTDAPQEVQGGTPTEGHAYRCVARETGSTVLHLEELSLRVTQMK